MRFESVGDCEIEVYGVCREDEKDEGCEVTKVFPPTTEQRCEAS